jgi:hypothetical protein
MRGVEIHRQDDHLELVGVEQSLRFGLGTGAEKADVLVKQSVSDGASASAIWRRQQHGAVLDERGFRRRRR